MMHFGVSLMVNFRMRALDESLLFIDWDLSSIAIRWNGQQALLASLSSVESCIIATKSSTLDLSIASSSAVKTSCLLAMPGM